MRNRTHQATAWALAVVAFAAAQPQALATTHTVNQVGITWVPADFTVQRGDTIEWVWADGIHSVTSGTPCTPDDRFHTPLTSGNPLVSHLIPLHEPATAIPYFCTPHCGDGMTGTITIAEDPGPVPAVSTWGAFALALLILSAGTIVVMNRRNVAA